MTLSSKYFKIYTKNLKLNLSIYSKCHDTYSSAVNFLILKLRININLYKNQFLSHLCEK